MKGKFLLSTLTEFPALKDPRGKPLPEVAIAGRSNVGKSSLINHLFGQKNLAKTSATPGKTQLLNFFLIDEKFLLADLPGYGFAKAPTDAIQKWSEAIDTYLNNRPTLNLVLLLLDIRRTPNEDDLALLEWAESRKIPLLLILTKTDKLTRPECEAQLAKMKELFRCDVLSYTVTNTHSRHYLEKRIREILWG